jgi:arylsulfatase B
VLQTIAAHDPSTPLFLFWAPHIVHAPLQVPQFYLDKFSFIDDSPRQHYMAMVNFLDDLVGRVVSALKKKGMWDNLVWASSADNGGPIYQSGAAGANNWPMRGGKMSNWQGGIRVNAFASGGFLPAAVRGTALAQGTNLAHGADWYATFCDLAGVDPFDTRAAAAGLPPVDGVSLWPMLSGANTTSPRTEIPIGSDASECNYPLGNGTTVQGLIRADGYKLLIGEIGQNIWTGPLYPNKSTSWVDTPYKCGNPGCLFNIIDDPTEHNEISAAHPDIVKAMYARILELQKTVFFPNRGTDDGVACTAALQKWGGFWGPFVA